MCVGKWVGVWVYGCALSSNLTFKLTFSWDQIIFFTVSFPVHSEESIPKHC